MSAPTARVKISMPRQVPSIESRVSLACEPKWQVTLTAGADSGFLTTPLPSHWPPSDFRKLPSLAVAAPAASRGKRMQRRRRSAIEFSPVSQALPAGFVFKNVPQAAGFRARASQKSGVRASFFCGGGFRADLAWPVAELDLLPLATRY